MNKNLTQQILIFLLLIVITLSSGCERTIDTVSLNLTPIPIKTQTPASTKKTFPTVTPRFAKTKATPTFARMIMTPGYYSVPTQQSNSECLPPLVNFAFPVGVIGSFGNVTPHPVTLPSGNWQAQIIIPEEFIFTGGYGETDIKNVGDEIWVAGHINYNGSTSFYIYNSKTNQARIIQGGKDEVAPQKIFATLDGSLWGFGSNGQSSLLSKYDYSKGIFESINDQEGVLRYSGYPSYIYDVQEEESGKIWILLEESGLYRFDPDTQKVDYFLAMPDEIRFAQIMPVKDGSIWILGHKGYDETILQRYFPDTGEMKKYEGTFSYSPRSEDILNLDISPRLPLFLDKYNRLWIGNEGWLSNPDSERPSWYRVIQSPIFIDATSDGVVVLFYRSRPYGMNETSDGVFWFWSDVGTARLNPQNGEWCLFTTYSSPVIEDNIHNLWMVAGGKLYKYKLEH